MGFKSWVIQKIAKQVHSNIQKWKTTAIEDQENIRKELIHKASNTAFGKDHQFSLLNSYQEFTQSIPTRDYEELRPYIDKILLGKENILWPGKPKYLAKTSGTTSGIKYIPITNDSLPNHIQTARTAMFSYFTQINNASVFDGRVIFLSGSPELSYKSGIPIGRLSGIINHEIPFWVKGSQLPSQKTNYIEDWEEKLDRIVLETIHQDMRLISGIPPWVQMYFEKILEKSGKKTILDVFPNFSLFMYGGVNYEPYRSTLEQLIGKRIDSIETYPASEGFIAFQDDINDPGLLLNTKSGIFFEFVQLDEIDKPNAERIELKDVTIGIDYAIILSNNAGLWCYEIGDCVRFTSINPYKIIVSGRVKHYISAFGEHVIGKEVEEAILNTAKEFNVNIIEFTVAPQVSPPEGGLPYHEWFIETDQEIISTSLFSQKLDAAMCAQNIYYDDLIKGNILRPLVVRLVKKETFRNYMKTKGKLGGQNKVPRLSNDRKIANELLEYIKN